VQYKSEKNILQQWDNENEKAKEKQRAKLKTVCFTETAFAQWLLRNAADKEFYLSASTH
jgi:hypothetical protein